MFHAIRIAAFAVAGVAAGHAFAQTSSSVPPKRVVPAQVGGVGAQQIQARREFLFQAMLQKPDDLDAAFEYAALSVQVGDIEAAISTLERMLIFAPGLPRLQLELGVLYYRLAAFETARGYFEGALAAPNVPSEVHVKVEQYLAGIDEAADPNRFAGQVRAGIRYQTNANRAPQSGTSIILARRPGAAAGCGFARLARRQRLRHRRVSLVARPALAGRYARSRPDRLRVEAVRAARNST